MLDCPVMVTVDVIGGRWKPRILWALRSGVQRFGELERATGASRRMLAKSLQELESDGLVERRVVPIGAVPTSEYSYSDYGRSLIPVLDSMGNWGQLHRRKAVP